MYQYNNIFIESEVSKQVLKSILENIPIDYKKLTHGFSMDRRPRYNNTLLWKEALERDNYEIAIKHESL